jgi:hypothetical protein
VRIIEETISSMKPLENWNLLYPKVNCKGPDQRPSKNSRRSPSQGREGQHQGQLKRKGKRVRPDSGAITTTTTSLCSKMDMNSSLSNSKRPRLMDQGIFEGL